MMKLRFAVAALTTLTLAAPLTSDAAVAAPKGKGCAALKVVDPDNDGSMDLAEAKKAATALFNKINKDKDKTLEAKELKGRMSAKELKAANPDNDGSLDLAEYLAEVEKRFKAANPDGDATIECKEIGTKEGKALMKLLK